MNSFDLWSIKRIKGEKIKPEPESADVNMDDETTSLNNPKGKRKRSNKRKNKSIKPEVKLGEDEQLFNEGDGLIDSDNEKTGAKSEHPLIQKMAVE